MNEDGTLENDTTRAPWNLTNIHHLLHVADCVDQFGPGVAFWQFPMERLVGLLGPMVKSRSKPYQNLAYNIVLYEKFYYFRYDTLLCNVRYSRPWPATLYVVHGANGGPLPLRSMCQFRPRRCSSTRDRTTRIESSAMTMSTYTLQAERWN